MTKKVNTLIAAAVLALAATEQTADAFAPSTFAPKPHSALVTRFAEEPAPAEGAFVAAEPAATDSDEADEDDTSFEAVEKFGRGAAKVCCYILLHLLWLNNV